LSQTEIAPVHGAIEAMSEFTQPASVTIATLLKDVQSTPESAFDLELVAGRSGLLRRITNSHPQKTGLALAGFDGYLRPGRPFILGESEIRYLESLNADDCRDALQRVMSHDLPCVVITQGLAAPPALHEAGDRYGVPILKTKASTPDAMSRLITVLDNHLADRTTVHGVLMDILGLGVLVVGESGIGKSECALDLIVRGHRLVSDDVVELRCRAEAFVLGRSPEATRHHMEIRGLGLINVRDLFGVASTRTSKRVELVVQLERWEPGREYDRLGLDDQRYEVLGVRIPMIRMPVAPGRSVAILVEVAARNQLLKARGHDAARKLVDRLDQRLNEHGHAASDGVDVDQEEC
jgi:HPr kinase/phosphorylase